MKRILSLVLLDFGLWQVEESLEQDTVVSTGVSLDGLEETLLVISLVSLGNFLEERLGVLREASDEFLVVSSESCNSLMTSLCPVIGWLGDASEESGLVPSGGLALDCVVEIVSSLGLVLLAEELEMFEGSCSEDLDEGLVVSSPLSLSCLVDDLSIAFEEIVLDSFGSGCSDSVNEDLLEVSRGVSLDPFVQRSVVFLSEQLFQLLHLLVGLMDDDINQSMLVSSDSFHGTMDLVSSGFSTASNQIDEELLEVEVGVVLEVVDEILLIELLIFLSDFLEMPVWSSCNDIDDSGSIVGEDVDCLVDSLCVSFCVE